MFKDLYFYEMKKIWCRKLIWIVLVIMAAIAIFSAYSPLTGNVYVNGELSDSHKKVRERKMESSRALSGRILGNELLNQIAEGYEKLPKGVEPGSMRKLTDRCWIIFIHGSLCLF